MPGGFGAWYEIRSKPDNITFVFVFFVVDILAEEGGFLKKSAHIQFMA